MRGGHKCFSPPKATKNTYAHPSNNKFNINEKMNKELQNEIKELIGKHRIQKVFDLILNMHPKVG